MNYLAIQQRHQNIQMRNQNVMLKQVLSSVGVNVSLHVTDVPDIASLTNIYTTSTYNITNPPTYERFYRHLLPEKGKKKIFFHTRNI